MSEKDLDSEIQAMQITLDAMSKLKPEEQKRVLDWLSTKLQISSAKTEPPAPEGISEAAKPDTALPVSVPDTTPKSAPTPKAFMDLKKPMKGVERVACLAYYLTHNRNTRLFKTADLMALNVEAAQADSMRPSDVANAERSSYYLAKAGSGQKQITSRGEAVVKALPDHDKVEDALKKHPIRKRRASKPRTKAK